MSRKKADTIREQFSTRLDVAFEKAFGRKLETEYNILAMRLVSYPADEKPLTKKQRDWIETFSNGYHEAMEAA